VNLCVVLRDIGEFREAERSGRRAVTINPESFQAWHNLANVYKDMGYFPEAISCYEKAKTLNPESNPTYTGLGIAYNVLGNTDLAVQCFKTALSANPSETTAVINLYHIAMLACDWTQAAHYENIVKYTTLESIQSNRHPAETAFINIIRSDDPGLNLAVARSWSMDIAKKMTNAICSLDFARSTNKDGKIRIGYLSNNFGDHPTGHITRRLYPLHDRNRFEITCFSYGPKDVSQYRHVIEKGCDHFVNIRDLSFSQAASVINGHGINILIDLVGYMKDERLSIAALRPAPVQVRWLGMAGTTGADFFDYIITDRIVTPPEHARFYSEKFIYLPHCYQINDNQPFVHPDRKGRAEFKLPENDFVFCCFNTSYKINAIIFDLWMRILRRTPRSVLWLMANSDRMKERLRDAANKKGIDDRRLIFAEKVTKPEHLARLAAADLALDTHLVNGAASTSDALWAGVPVLTVQGNHFASRMASSILTAAGLPDLIARNLIEYEEKAVTLAQDKNEFGPIKQALQSTVPESPLFNTEQFVRDLEKGYELIWNRHLNGEDPRLIEV
jgi:protein O-GlcNAc transferase